MKAKKSLGQNFLINPAVVEKIIGAANIKEEETVLEVGPGTGVLTEALIKAGANVIAIEKDHRLIESLKKKFPTAKVIEGDILNVEMSNLQFANNEEMTKFKIVANIPYYITGEFLRKFLTSAHPPTLMVLMLQKEVAERICDTKESLLSLSVKAYGEPKIIMQVPRADFEPAPDVDSAVLLIENISKKFFTESNLDENKFFDFIRSGFAHKRKMLGSNIPNIPDLYKKMRAEELDASMWRELYEIYQQNNPGQN